MPGVGVFDSGLGGLSVLSELRRELPQERFVYLADHRHCPYGERTDGEVRAYTAAGVRWLLDMGVEAVVIACNTACAFSLRPLRAELGESRPLIGLVPAVKPAVSATRSGVVAVLATPVTLRGSLLAEVERDFAAPAGVTLLHLNHPALVPMVERGELDTDATREALRAVLDPALAAGADSLVLGCTHFPFLASTIRALYGDALSLYDSGAGVARQTRRVLSARGDLAEGGRGDVTFYTSGDPLPVTPVLARLWGPAELRHTQLGEPTLVP